MLLGGIAGGNFNDPDPGFRNQLAAEELAANQAMAQEQMQLQMEKQQGLAAQNQFDQQMKIQELLQREMTPKGLNVVQMPLFDSQGMPTGETMPMMTGYMPGQGIFSEPLGMNGYDPLEN